MPDADERATAWHALPPDEVARRLASDGERGLTEREAKLRRSRYGPNRIEAGRTNGPLRLLASQFASVLVLLLLAATAISFLLGEWLDAAAIAAILILNAVLGFVQEYRAGQALQALLRMAAPQATVIRDGVAGRVPAEALVPGDLIEVAAGEAVPADARVVAAGLEIGEAALTGESLPVSKTVGAVATEAPLAERTSMLYGGTLALQGRGRALVTATGRATEFGRIAELVRTAQLERTPLEQGLDRTGRWLALGSLIAAALVFLSVLLGSGDLGEALLTAVALAVAAIPEGLPAAVTIVLAIGVQRMAARHAIVRRLAAVETLGCTTVICTDKTGTVTQNALAVRRLWCGGRTLEIDEHAALDGVRAPEIARAVQVTALSLGGEAASEHAVDPTDIALARLVERAGATVQRARDGFRMLAEYPFDSDRKRSGAAYATPEGGRVVVVKGAPEAVLERCVSVQVEGGPAPLDAAWRGRVEAVVGEFAGAGMRPIALAAREVAAVGAETADADAAERELTLVAVVGMMDALRPEVPVAIGVAARAGVRTIMITGDHPATARTIAREAGLAAEPRVLAGAELARMDEGRFEEALPGIDVYARVTSEDKLRIVRAWKRAGAVVAMTGDGVNDAPALREADIGVAMGLAGTDVARQSADVILTDDNYATIVAAVEDGRTIFNNIRRFVMYLVSGNLAEILVVLLAGLSGSSPLLPVQILWLNLVTDSLPALALGLEPAEPGVMARPPRAPRSGVLTARTLPRIALSVLLIAVPTLIAWAIGHGRGGVEEARHFAFGTLVAAHLLTAFTFRNDVVPLHRLGLRTNRQLVYAVAAGLALQAAIFYVPAAQAVFSTDAFSARELAAVVGLSLPALAVPEVVKAVRP